MLDGMTPAPQPLTDEELADLIPETAAVLKIEGERKKVCMTRAELHQFAQAVRARGVTESTAPRTQTAEIGSGARADGVSRNNYQTFRAESPMQEKPAK